jgi:SOS-response transcriptional repressor LexA
MNSLIFLREFAIEKAERIGVTKYERAIKDLEEIGTAKMKVFGSSMTPIIKSGSLLTFQKCEEYESGDIVFCKVKGRYIDAHLVKTVSHRGHLITNNHGYANGWTKKIFGKVIEVEPPNKTKKKKNEKQNP